MENSVKRIKAPDGMSATMTTVSQDKTLHQHPCISFVIETDDDRLYRIDLTPEQYSKSFADKLISAFRFNPAWREHFRVYNKPHETVEITYADGSKGKADANIAPYVQALNLSGYRTLSSCEGDHAPNGRVPFIGFEDAMPENLEAVMNQLGWVNFDRSISPIPCHGGNHLYRAMFFLALDDWLANDLDMSCARYGLQRKALPRIPELPPVNARALADHQATVTKRVKRINTLGEKATFNDLVRLRCGRDRYSTWKLDDLKKALSNDPSLEQLEARIFDKASLQRALRWRMRGLDLVMVLKKHEVDQILEASKLAKKNARLAEQNGTTTGDAFA